MERQTNPYGKAIKKYTKGKARQTGNACKLRGLHVTWSCGQVAILSWSNTQLWTPSTAHLLRLFRVRQGFFETRNPPVASPLKLRSYVVTYGSDLQTLLGEIVYRAPCLRLSTYFEDCVIFFAQQTEQTLAFNVNRPPHLSCNTKSHRSFV